MWFQDMAGFWHVIWCQNSSNAEIAKALADRWHLYMPAISIIKIVPRAEIGPENMWNSSTELLLQAEPLQQVEFSLYILDSL